MRPTSTVLLAVLAALLPAAPARSAELGLNINGAAAGGANYQNFEDLSELRSGWARHFLHWDDFDYQQGWGGYQQMIAEEERRGVKTLIAVKAAGNQPPADPQAFADRMAQIARTLKGVDALQVWSEADEPLFWAGAPQPAAYVDLLKRSYAAVKGVSDALVVFSATVGNNFGFVQAAYEAGAKGHFDVMAVHTDTACLVQPPSFYYREQDGRIGRFAFLGHRGVHDVMQANGDGHKPIWMTEFGWSAAEHVCEFGAGAGQRPAGVGEERQARYLLEAMNCLERDPYVTVAMWFNNRDLSGDGKMQNTYGLRRHDGSPRPAFEAFKTWTGGGGRSNAPCGDFEGPPVRLLAPEPGYVLGEYQNLTIRAPSDAPDLKRIYFSVEGPGAQPLFADGPSFLLRPGDAGPIAEREWGGARDLRLGTHELTVYAVDQLDNAGPPVTVAFTKRPVGSGGGDSRGGGAAGGGAAGNRARFPKLMLKGRGLRRSLSGAALPGIGGGAVRAEWQHRRRGRWKRLHAATKAARFPFTFRQKLSHAGRWRVRLVYLGKGPIRRTRSCWIVFHTRSAKTRLACPRGAVRPLR